MSVVCGNYFRDKIISSKSIIQHKLSPLNQCQMYPLSIDPKGKLEQKNPKKDKV